MNEHEFLSEVEDRTDVESREDAYAVTDATLQTLSDRVGQGEAEDVASQLPRQVAASLRAGPPEAESFGVDEFVDRVGSRERTLGEFDHTDSERDAKAVLSVLSEAVSGGELDDATEQLPDEYDRLLEPADTSEIQA